MTLLSGFCASSYRYSIRTSREKVPPAGRLAFPAPVLAQGFEWLPGGTYDPAIPESVLGYEIGTYLTDHLQMVDYIHQLGESTDKVQLFKFGQTHERRDMYVLVVSAPHNMERLEEIRGAIERLTDPRTTGESQASAIARETPPIGWINFGTDGNETSAFECAMQLAYQLAAGTDPLTGKLLDNVVTVINPLSQPGLPPVVCHPIRSRGRETTVSRRSSSVMVSTSPLLARARSWWAATRAFQSTLDAGSSLITRCRLTITNRLPSGPSSACCHP
jgi:hypothetical protein